MRINVAFFERLKFQTAVSMPKTPVIAGEKIQAGLNASYLAGGALASAKFETNWFREPWYFTSDEPDLSGSMHIGFGGFYTEINVYVDEADLESFRARHGEDKAKRGNLSEEHGALFLGLDAGSTTTTKGAAGTTTTAASTTTKPAAAADSPRTGVATVAVPFAALALAAATAFVSRKRREDE